MNYRQTSLLSHESIATAGTKTLDITIKDVISRICIQVKATNDGNTPTAHGANIIKKIELIDGSDVLWGLSGKEALALEFYDTGRSPFAINMYVNNVMNITNYNINFGRKLYDTLLAFDPKKYRNPQLKITHDLSLGGSAPDAATLEVVADVFDDKTVTPVGFLMAKELVSYVLATNANEYIDLPTDYAMRKLLVMSLFTGKQPWEQYNEIKLSEDNDKRIPFNDKTSDLLKYMGSLYGPVEENIFGVTGATAVTHYLMSTYEAKIVGGPWGDYAAFLKPGLSYGGTCAVKASAACNFQALVRGFAPFGAICLPFGDQTDAADWYDVTKVGNLRATIKGGSSPGSNSTCELVSQQLRSYAAA